MRKLIGAIRRVFRDPAYINYYYRRYASIVKMIIAYIASLTVKGILCKRNIWLVREKGTEARDNGYHFFKYICNHHPEINVYYVIKRNSPDLQKVEKIGNVVFLNTFKHFVYYLCAKVSVGSQPFGAVPDPTDETFRVSKSLHRKDQVVVHLKHGVTKDELPHELDYSYTHFDLLCCVSERERIFMQEMHGYPDDNIKTLGFCRYDKLLESHEIKKQVLVMPTHRMWLHAANAEKSATAGEMRHFEKTDFYRAYSELLQNTDLLNNTRKAGYSVVFYPHYAIQSFISCFEGCANDVVTIADREHYDVQQLLMESALLVTDYSSVFFDFAFMEKPEVFYQFDETRYREKHFKKGYFDYRRDGFGPVYNDINGVVDEIKTILDRGCTMSALYRQRVDSFFTIRDTDNCKRTYEEVYRKAKNK